MGFYKTYNHATDGIVILDESGFDRIGPSTGMIINDEQGNERSGYGLLKVDGHYRAVPGLDSAQGRILRIWAMHLREIH